nr:hypothetical protein Iba_chr04dCG7600 [Ipomoea batatas]
MPLHSIRQQWLQLFSLDVDGLAWLATGYWLLP